MTTFNLLKPSLEAIAILRGNTQMNKSNVYLQFCPKNVMQSNENEKCWQTHTPALFKINVTAQLCHTSSCQWTTQSKMGKRERNRCGLFFCLAGSASINSSSGPQYWNDLTFIIRIFFKSCQGTRNKHLKAAWSYRTFICNMCS